MKVFDLMTGGDKEKVNHPTSSNSSASGGSVPNPLHATRSRTLSQKLQVHCSHKHIFTVRDTVTESKYLVTSIFLFSDHFNCPELDLLKHK
jgi:hypothetical protein